MIQVIEFIRTQANSLYDFTSSSLSELTDDLTNRTADVAKKVLLLGIHTATCWSLWWMNPRIAPIGYMVGFVGRKPVQWIIDDLTSDPITDYKFNVFLVSVSMALSGVVTFPVVIPTAILSGSVLLGKQARDILFPSTT